MSAKPQPQQQEEDAALGLEKFQAQLTAYMPEIARVLPDTISAERFAQICMNAVLGNDRLRKAVTGSASARRTFFAEVLKCATDGLIPDGREAVFNTFTLRDVGPVVKYMPMTEGLMKVVRNSGEIKDISTHVVYEGDAFEYIQGDDEKIVHKRPPFGTPRGKPIGAYCIVKTIHEGVYREVMDEAQIQAVASCSRATGDDSPWKGKFADEMRRKTVFRRTSKRLPKSSDVAGVLARDDDLYEFAPPAAANEPQEPAKPGPATQAAKTREAMGLGASTPAGGGESQGQPEPPPQGSATPPPAGGSPVPPPLDGGDTII